MFFTDLTTDVETRKDLTFTTQPLERNPNWKVSPKWMMVLHGEIHPTPEYENLFADWKEAQRRLSSKPFIEA